MNGSHPSDDRLIAHVLDELEPSDGKEVEAHLTACGKCRGIVSSLGRALAGVRASAPPEAPAHVLVDLLEVQAAARARSPWHRRVLGPIPMAAGIALLAALFLTGFWTGRHTASTALPPPAGEPSPPPVRVERTAPQLQELPAPPEIPFQTAMASEGWASR